MALAGDASFEPGATLAEHSIRFLYCPGDSPLNYKMLWRSAACATTQALMRILIHGIFDGLFGLQQKDRVLRGAATDLQISDVAKIVA